MASSNWPLFHFSTLPLDSKCATFVSVESRWVSIEHFHQPTNKQYTKLPRSVIKNLVLKSDKKRQIIEEVEENRARCKGQKPKLQQMANNTTIHIISIWLIAAIVIFTFGQKNKTMFLTCLKKRTERSKQTLQRIIEHNSSIYYR